MKRIGIDDALYERLILEKGALSIDKYLKLLLDESKQNIFQLQRK